MHGTKRMSARQRKSHDNFKAVSRSSVGIKPRNFRKHLRNVTIFSFLYRCEHSFFFLGQSLTDEGNNSQPGDAPSRSD